MLDEASAVPLYHQIKTLLREKVESGEWKPHDMIPSELELAKIFGVSRATIRRAVLDLSREGVFYRKQGKGTFVNAPKIEQELTRFYTFSDEMGSKGLVPRSEIFGLERVIANNSAVKYLSVSENTELWQLRRLGIANDEPIMLETSWLPVEMCPGLTIEDISENTLYGVLSEKYGIYLIRVEEFFEPVLTDAYEAALLTVEEGSPALLLHRIAYTYEDKPVELCKSIVRGDRCRYYVNLNRTKS